MAKRCFYYMEDNSIIEQWIDISWDKGFSKDAKHSYIEEAQEIAIDLHLLYGSHAPYLLIS